MGHPEKQKKERQQQIQENQTCLLEKVQRRQELYLAMFQNKEFDLYVKTLVSIKLNSQNAFLQLLTETESDDGLKGAALTPYESLSTKQGENIIRAPSKAHN